MNLTKPHPVLIGRAQVGGETLTFDVNEEGFERGGNLIGYCSLRGGVTGREGEMLSRKGNGLTWRRVSYLLLLLLSCGAVHAGTHHYYYTDPQGNVLAVADQAGNIIERHDYAPYGASVPSLGSPPNGPGYAGHVNDPDTGFVYMQARYYDPAIGRFLSVDPQNPAAGDLSNFNRFAYASNNPIANVDRNGRQSLPLSSELGTTDPKVINNVLRAQNENAGTVLQAFNSATEPLMFAYPELDVGALLGGATEAMGFGAASARTAIAGSEVPLATPLTALSTYRMTTEGETFFHYSQASYANSFAGGLRPGGFATSMGDLTGAEAKSGLALPHANAPNAVYSVAPEPNTWVRVNPVAEPLNGQTGGLPEYQFPQGTAPGTVSKPRMLSDLN